MKKLIPLLSGMVLLFSSCLDSTISIKLNKDLSGSLEAVYSISGESEYVSSDLTAMTYEYLPADGVSLKRIADETDGLTLDSFKQTEKGPDVVDSLTAHFDSIRNIEKLSGYRGGVKILSLREGAPGTLQVVLTNPLDKNVSAKTLQILSALYRHRKITITLQVSGFITNTDAGALSEDPSTAVYSLPLMKLLTSRDQIVWTITYRR